MSAKYLMDNVWGEIMMTPLARKFLDVPEFQRMRFMKQLGPCNFVYTCAEISRFTHSVGVYNLARRLCLSLQKKHPSLVDDRKIELISVAALYHDIGHGPFSHTFDRVTNTDHEERSKVILKYVVRKYDIPVTQGETDFMINVIDPVKEKKKWFNQIVSNGDVDVDRMDYLVRDSKATGVSITLNDKSVLKLIDRAYIEPSTLELVYPSSVNYVIQDLLDSRQYMFERVYRHHTALKVEKLIMLALKGRLVEQIGRLEGFLNLSDSILTDVYHTTEDEYIKECVHRIFTRQLIIPSKPPSNVTPP